jgi:hypothetical protein
MRALLVGFLLLLGALGCGDGVFIISFTTGTVVNTASCHDGAGQFDLLEQGGLVVLVVIDTGTDIVLSNGFPGTCADVTAGKHAEVRGNQQGATINAVSVQLQ